MVNSLGAVWREAARALADISDTPALDAQVLLAHVVNMDRATLLAYPERPLSPEDYRRYDELVQALRDGTPLPYLVSRRSFYRHDFAVRTDVLIPRPETEHLVEAAIAWVRANHPKQDDLTLVDVGTGSGAIAISLALALPNTTVHATDISPAALEVAQHNAQQLACHNIHFHQGDLLDALPAGIQVDLIAANLPYIASADLDSLAVAQHEPRLALDGGPDGLALIRRMLTQAPERITPTFCLLEIGADQGAAVVDLCHEVFPDSTTRIIQDYAGHDRVVEICRYDLP